MTQTVMEKELFEGLHEQQQKNLASCINGINKVIGINTRIYPEAQQRLSYTQRRFKEV